MGVNASLLEYQARVVALHAAASQLRLGQMIALIAMSAAIVATLVIGFLFSREARFCFEVSR